MMIILRIINENLAILMYILIIFIGNQAHKVMIIGITGMMCGMN